MKKTVPFFIEAIYVLPLLLALLFSTTISAQAPAPVTAVFTHRVAATTSASYSGTGANGLYASGMAGNTYNYMFGSSVAATNNTQILDSFTAATLNYHFTNVASTIKFRRVDNATVTGARKSLFFEHNGTTISGAGDTGYFLPDYDDSLERLFTKRIFNVGIDNTFQNNTGTNNNNIERMDVIFPQGIKATDLTKAGFVVFERGNVGSRDPFQIAVIQSLDGSGDPSAYYNAVSVTNANYGSISSPFSYHILRKEATDANLLLMVTNNSQGRDGIFFNFASLNVPSTNTYVYGYSIFPTDVITSPAANMVDYTNATNFPTNSVYVNGGIDPLAVTGVWVTDDSYMVLPEKILSFNVTSSSGTVRLDWQLGTTDRLKETVIERSTDGINFSPLHVMNSLSTGNITDFDRQPFSGVNYYRLKLVDNIGKVAFYSAVKTVKVSGADNSFMTVYPNPARNKQFTLTTYGLKNESYQLQLIDITGKTVFEKSIDGGTMVKKDISLPTTVQDGNYVIRLSSKDGQHCTSSVIVHTF